MGYAIRNDGLGWRAVDGESDIIDGEHYSENHPPQIHTENMRTSEILARLTQIDIDSVRPLRAIASGNDTQFDRDKLAALDAEASALRAELASL